MCCLCLMITKFINYFPNGISKVCHNFSVSDLIVWPLETIHASPGVALARGSQFSYLSLKPLFQKMGVSVLSEVHTAY